MKNIRILDCTLRDGGRVIDCEFPDSEIKEITEKLVNAKIDIVEVGFLRDQRKLKYQGGSTFFTDVNQIIPFVDKTKNNVLYVAFIDYGMYDIEQLKYYDGVSIDGIRLGFTKKNYSEERDEIIRWARIIKERGYRLFIQGVNSLNYSDYELLEMLEMVNEIHPYSFGIVDTYGAMYMDDVDRLYSLVDHNLASDICINFHSHNNYQLSFAFAQEIIKLSSTGNRQIIIDGTLGGMGKVAGNLNTELIVDFLVRKKHYDYEYEDILDILDDYIYKYQLEHQWGYSTAAMMAGIYKSHPNNVIYLTEKFRLDTKDIGKILSMIDPEMRQRYDYNNIEKLYTEYVAEKVDDYSQIQKLKEVVENQEVLILVPGNSLRKKQKEISAYVEKNQPTIIGVNFIPEDNSAYTFFGNSKRYNLLKETRQGRKIIITSNVKSDNVDDSVINYHSVINRGNKYFENSTIMLLNLLKRLNPKEISIAGFDGFDIEKENNYADGSFQNRRYTDNFEELNMELSNMFSEIVKTLEGKCKVSFVTPSIFEKCI